MTSQKTKTNSYKEEKIEKLKKQLKYMEEVKRALEYAMRNAGRAEMRGTEQYIHDTAYADCKMTIRSIEKEIEMNTKTK